MEKKTTRKNIREKTNSGALREYKIDLQPHAPSEIVNQLAGSKDWPKVRKNKTKHRGTITYYNVPAALDIETSTFFWTPSGVQKNQDEKNAMPKKVQDTLQNAACLTCWQVGLDGVGYLGREWDDLFSTFAIIRDMLGLNDTTRLVMYVHNLSYEFQWIRKRTKISEVFAVNERKPVRAFLCEYGIELRDSLILTGLSLEKSAENLTKYKIGKQVGDWNYKKIRTTQTPLTEQEKRYALYDVLVVMSIVREKIEEEGKITNIPMTNTGYVRRYCRQKTILNKNRKIAAIYREIIHGLTITPKEYEQLKKTFQGGLTHANALYVGKVLENVRSYDLTSDYPSQMVLEMYPMGRAPDVKITSLSQLEEMCEKYCCMFHVKLLGVSPKIEQENILSSSKCNNMKGQRLNNGRVVYAEELDTWVTEQDWYNIKDCYNFEHVEIAEFVRYYKAYLPTPFVSAILDLYAAKTTLKNVDGKEAEYLLKKGMLNSCYGMAVTDIVNALIRYQDEWLEPEPVDYEDQIRKYNNSYSRYLYYPWGVWVTAYARRTLVKAIVACGNNYVYSDTDSIKFLKDGSGHFEKYIENYNAGVVQKLEKACEYHGIDWERVAPKTVKGKTKVLGLWDYDGDYKRFKTLGAKRYVVEYDDGKIVTTVAGSNKSNTADYITDTTIFSDPFTAFDDNLVIPAAKSGKSCHTYIDEEIGGIVTDYLGNPAFYNEKSCVALVEIPFTMTIGMDFKKYLHTIRVDSK